MMDPGTNKADMFIAVEPRRHALQEFCHLGDQRLQDSTGPRPDTGELVKTIQFDDLKTIPLLVDVSSSGRR